MSPKKPNSAKRSVAKVRILSTKKVIQSQIPGINHNLQEQSMVLLRGARIKDLPGVKTKIIRGCFDCSSDESRISSRSKQGNVHPKKKV